MTILLLIFYLMLPWMAMDIYFLFVSILLRIKCNSPFAPSSLDACTSLPRNSCAILIPMYNNKSTVLSGIVQTLKTEYFSRQRDLPINVILIDSSTDNSTSAVLKTLNLTWDCITDSQCIATRDRFTFIHLRQRMGGKAWAINQVALRLPSTYFAILDSDWSFDATPFLDAVAYLESHPHLAYAQLAWQAQNRQLSTVEGLDQVAIEFSHQHEDPARTWRGIPVTIHGSAVVVRTQCFRAVDGFREDVLSEDVDLTVRMMLAGMFGSALPTLRMRHAPCDHWKQFILQKIRWTEGRCQLLRDHMGPLIKTTYMTAWQKIAWLFYLSYFTRFIGFAAASSLFIYALATSETTLKLASAELLAGILTLRLAGNLITWMQKLNRIPWWCRLLQPISYYVIGIVYLPTLIRGLLTKKGSWHVIECKNVSQ